MKEAHSLVCYLSYSILQYYVQGIEAKPNFTKSGYGIKSGYIIRI